LYEPLARPGYRFSVGATLYKFLSNVLVTVAAVAAAVGHKSSADQERAGRQGSLRLAAKFAARLMARRSLCVGAFFTKSRSIRNVGGRKRDGWQKGPRRFQGDSQLA
jgi:hypothetical protein